jgi:hypothetical protein
VLDTAEEWLVCPCRPHGRRASEWAAQAFGRSRRGRLADWAAGLAGAAEGYVSAPAPRRVGGPDAVEALCAGLRAWAIDGRDTVDPALWLPADGRGLRPLLECPPIDWRCQECNAFVVRTTEVFPQETNGDSDCLDHPERRCSAGYSMTMTATCSACGEDLDMGRRPCPHFALE